MDGLKELLEKLVPGLQYIFGDNLERIVLYGSFAKKRKQQNQTLISP